MKAKEIEPIKRGNRFFGELVKILHIGKYYHPYSGGMESILRDLCEGLSQKGHDVTVLCSNTSAQKSIENLNGVKVIRLARTGVLFGQNINPTLFIEMMRLAREADIVHVHSPNPLAEMLSLFLPKSVALVSTHHSDIIRQKTLLKFYKPFLIRFFKRAQKVFVPTKNHIKFSDFLIHFENKCELIPFGIRTDFLKSTEANLEKAKNFRSEFGPYALFVGRLVSYKGIRFLIDAAKDTQGSVVIVGHGPLKAELELQVKQLGLQEKVKILGRVKDNYDFVGLYHGCDMLVLPSITPNENFGVVQLEAMACSKPVVTTNLKSGVPAVGIKGKTTLIVEPEDSQQLSKAMDMIFLNHELKTKMGRAAFEHYQNFYTWQGMIETQIDAYKRIKEITTIINKHRKEAA